MGDRQLFVNLRLGSDSQQSMQVAKDFVKSVRDIEQILASSGNKLTDLISQAGAAQQRSAKDTATAVDVAEREKAKSVETRISNQSALENDLHRQQQQRLSEQEKATQSSSQANQDTSQADKNHLTSLEQQNKALQASIDLQKERNKLAYEQNQLNETAAERIQRLAEVYARTTKTGYHDQGGFSQTVAGMPAGDKQAMTDMYWNDANARIGQTEIVGMEAHKRKLEAWNAGTKSAKAPFDMAELMRTGGTMPDIGTPEQRETEEIMRQYRLRLRSAEQDKQRRSALSGMGVPRKYQDANYYVAPTYAATMRATSMGQFQQRAGNLTRSGGAASSLVSGLTTNMTKLARAVVLATAANEDSAKASFKMIAKFESIAQGISGGIGTAGSLLQGMSNFKNLKDDFKGMANALKMFGQNAKPGTLGSLAKYVPSGAAIGRFGAAAYGSVPVAAAGAAAAGGTYMGGKAIYETVTGTGYDEDSYSMWMARQQMDARKQSGFKQMFGIGKENDFSIGGYLKGSAYNAARVGTLGAMDAGMHFGGVNEALGQEQLSQEKLDRMTEARRKRVMQEQFREQRWITGGGRADFNQERRMASFDMQTGAMQAGFGLEEGSTAQAQARFSFREKALAGQVSGVAIGDSSGGKSERVDRLNEQIQVNQQLQQLEQQRLDLAKRTSQDQITAAEKQLQLTQQDLALKEQAERMAEASVDRTVGVLTGTDETGRGLLRKAALKANEDPENLTIEEAKRLQGLDKYRDVANQALERRAAEFDPDNLFGLKDQVAARAEARAETKEVKLSIDNQQKILVEITSAGEEAVKQATEQFEATMKKLYESQKAMMERVASLESDIANRGN